MDTAAAECARAYYRALDAGDYDALEGLLAPGFVHDRPDRTFEGRERFVRFMREDRPNSDTTHRIEGVYHADGPDSDAAAGDAGGDGSGRGDGRNDASDASADVAVQGRLLDGEEGLFEFVDLFEVADGRIERVDTYARSV